jgi:NAD(P)-dependent dehydrogenase (short-subunit alcohol dehydrogenase family)
MTTPSRKTWFVTGAARGLGAAIARAALDAGYADATHFSHSFRATFGVNPAPVFRTLGRFEMGP